MWRDNEKKKLGGDLEKKKKWEERPFTVSSQVRNKFGAEKKASQQRKRTVMVEYLLFESVVG